MKPFTELAMYIEGMQTRRKLDGLSRYARLDNLMNEVQADLASAHSIMKKFVNKVDTGMARSTETYREMKEWLNE